MLTSSNEGLFMQAILVLFLVLLLKPIEPAFAAKESGFESIDYKRIKFKRDGTYKLDGKYIGGQNNSQNNIEMQSLHIVCLSDSGDTLISSMVRQTKSSL